MKKNHLDFKDLAQSLAMDKVKLQRYVTVSFLLQLFNNRQSRQISNRCSDSAVRMHEMGPNQKKKAYGIIEKELF